MIRQDNNIRAQIEARWQHVLDDELQHSTEVEDSICEAITRDPNSDPTGEMIRMSAVGRELASSREWETAKSYFSGKQDIPLAWITYLETGKHPPFNFETTSFINLFGGDTALLLDMYRPPWKQYFTSDVFFMQWLMANRRQTLKELPSKFPSTLYVHNVVHKETKYMAEKMLGKEKLSVLKYNDEAPIWRKLNATPHIKCVRQILSDYNQLNSLRGFPHYRIDTLQIYQVGLFYHLKFRIDKCEPSRTPPMSG